MGWRRSSCSRPWSWRVNQRCPDSKMPWFMMSDSDLKDVLIREEWAWIDLRNELSRARFGLEDALFVKNDPDPIWKIPWFVKSEPEGSKDLMWTKAWWLLNPVPYREVTRCRYVTNLIARWSCSSFLDGCRSKWSASDVCGCEPINDVLKLLVDVLPKIALFSRSAVFYISLGLDIDWLRLTYDDPFRSESVPQKMTCTDPLTLIRLCKAAR